MLGVESLFQSQGFNEQVVWTELEFTFSFCRRRGQGVLPFIPLPGWDACPLQVTHLRLPLIDILPAPTCTYKPNPDLLIQGLAHLNQQVMYCTIQNVPQCSIKFTTYFLFFSFFLISFTRSIQKFARSIPSGTIS